MECPGNGHPLIFTLPMASMNSVGAGTQLIVFFFNKGLNHSVGTSPWAVCSGLGRGAPSRMNTGGVQRTSSCQRSGLGA